MKTVDTYFRKSALASLSPIRTKGLSNTTSVDGCKIIQSVCTNAQSNTAKYVPALGYFTLQEPSTKRNGAKLSWIHTGKPIQNVELRYK